MIEVDIKRRGVGTENEYRWRCSLCSKLGSWEKDVKKVLDAGEQHAKGEHPRTEKGDN